MIGNTTRGVWAATVSKQGTVIVHFQPADVARRGGRLGDS